MSIPTGVATAMIIVVGGIQVLHNQLKVGDMVVYVILVQRFLRAGAHAVHAIHFALQRAMAAGYRILEVLDVTVSIKNKPDAIALTGEDLDHRYRPRYLRLQS